MVNPFRATLVLGTPGSGKSYCVINQFIKQQIAKGYALYCYDFKYPDLSTIVYNHRASGGQIDGSYDEFRIVGNFPINLF